MNFKLFFYSSLSILFFFSCKTPKETDDQSTFTKVMEMKKNPCFGKCPVYTLSIYKGRIAIFDGKMFTEKYGLHTRKLNKSDYKNLKKAFEAADFFSLEDSYPSNIPDIPKTNISFHKKGKSKTITGDINRPQVLLDLEKQMEKIADADGWTLRSVPDANLPDYYITNELIVSFKGDIDVKEWIKKYSDWDMQIKKSIAPNRNLWLFTYDDTDLKPNVVMNKLSMDDDVLVLEFNKKLEERKN